mmetsp:Transcript_25963/g.76099  ORF Transcript_25963/g.76099 Transcript_25963/m.76099 type:complete len:208 (-) Transcript_25963:664-1287(-)
MALAWALASADWALRFFASLASRSRRSAAVRSASSASLDPATSSSSDWSAPLSPPMSMYSKESARPSTGTAAMATRPSCQAPRPKMSPKPMARELRLATRMPVCSPVTELTSVTSRERFAVRLAAEFSGWSNHPISCRSMEPKAVARRRRVRRSPATPRPKSREVCSVSWLTAMAMMTPAHRRLALRTSSGSGRKKTKKSSVSATPK